jgi:hypothetical protein
MVPFIDPLFVNTVAFPCHHRGLGHELGCINADAQVPARRIRNKELMPKW